MRSIIVLIFLFLIIGMNGCANKLLRQSPPLAAYKTFYKVEKEVGIISHNRCEKLNGEDRECTKTLYKIEEMWDIFYPEFIIIPMHMVF